MKFILIFALCLIALSSILVMDVYASTHNRSHPSLIEVSLQIQVRDSEGHLIAYIEPNLMYILGIEKLHEKLDQVEDKEKILINGVEHELVEIHQAGFFTEKRELISAHRLYYQGESVLLINYDGLIVEPGDRWIADWKIIRTIR